MRNPRRVSVLPVGSWTNLHCSLEVRKASDSLFFFRLSVGLHTRGVRGGGGRGGGKKLSVRTSVCLSLCVPVCVCVHAPVSVSGRAPRLFPQSTSTQVISTLKKSSTTNLTRIQVEENLNNNNNNDNNEKKQQPCISLTSSFCIFRLRGTIT